MPEEKFVISYVQADNRPTIVATGAHGGPAPDGCSVVANLYVEGGTLPLLEEHKVGKGGVIQLKDGVATRHSDLTRNVVAALVLAPENAVRIGQWLSEKGRQAIKIRDQAAAK